MLTAASALYCEALLGGKTEARDTVTVAGERIGDAFFGGGQVWSLAYGS